MQEGHGEASIASWSIDVFVLGEKRPCLRFPVDFPASAELACREDHKEHLITCS